MKILVAIALLLSASTFSLAQNSQSALTEMVKTEQAFSKTAEVKSTREAFMEFIADDGLLFRPGAVNGKKWMQEHPVPPSDKRPLLAWQPIFAGMSASGDFGFTTGPWEFKGDIKDEKPAGYGHFITVWKKQADGAWKFEVDLGISHPVSGGPQSIWMPTETKTSGSTKAVSAESEKLKLRSDDQKLAEEIEKKGASAFFARAESGVRVYRVDHLPQIGKAQAEKIFLPEKTQMRAKVLDSDVAKAGDVGYTRGTYEMLDAAAKVVDQGSYVRIWRKHSGEWKVVIDVINTHQ